MGELRDAEALFREQFRRNGGDAVGATAPPPAAALEETRVDLVQRIRDGIPECECVPGGEGWLYRGKRYLAYAGAGVGKSLAWLAISVTAVERDATVAIVDSENGSDEYARRLECILRKRAHVAPACSERLRYYEYPRLSLHWIEADWIEAVKDVDLLIIDSSRVTLSSVGLSEDSNDDYARFMNALVCRSASPGSPRWCSITPATRAATRAAPRRSTTPTRW